MHLVSVSLFFFSPLLDRHCLVVCAVFFHSSHSSSVKVASPLTQVCETERETLEWGEKKRFSCPLMKLFTRSLRRTFQMEGAREGKRERVANPHRSWDFFRLSTFLCTQEQVNLLVFFYSFLSYSVSPAGVFLFPRDRVKGRDEKGEREREKRERERELSERGSE